MKRYLVVANQTLGGDALLDHLRRYVAAGPCTVHVVVPASPDPTESWHDHRSDRALAQRRLAEALRRFGEFGVPVTGEVGDHRPVDAVLDVLLRGDHVDEIVVSTLPERASRWLRLDVVSRIRRAVDVPLHHVTAVEVPATSGS